MDTILNFFKNLFTKGYKAHDEAIIIACYFNPENNPYRLKAFNVWYESIKHLNHRIIECSVEGSEFQLPKNNNIFRVSTDIHLWHKETLLNKIIKTLPEKYKYVFWMDTDVVLSNKHWLTTAVSELKHGKTVVQPFENCKHLEKDITWFTPFESYIASPMLVKEKAASNIWNSFAFVYNQNKAFHKSNDYELHGHVGFLWGARREVLDEVPLFEKALIGGADHIIAHATTGQFHEKDINDVFNDNIQVVNSWMYKWWEATGGELGYVRGNLFHLWHGDLKARDYYNRIKGFTKMGLNVITDSTGFHKVDNNGLNYFKTYYKQRESVEKIALVETPVVPLHKEQRKPIITSLREPKFKTFEDDAPKQLSLPYSTAVKDDIAIDIKALVVEETTSTIQHAIATPPADFSSVVFNKGDFGGGGAEGEYELPDIDTPFS